ncbi:GNAT family N-acetyltransferase [Saccharopolyspora sp. MS10]|uniref:GNAT family N-acetyltransferase n=1 Tax=Saccharopolyspora sp. MS10 TaxID=3385973 RepID=UPI0039A14834
MEPREELHLDGVHLRRWRLEDAGPVLGAVTESLEHLAPWMPWAVPGYGMKEATDFVGKNVREWDEGTTFNYAILAPDGQVVGSAGLMARIGPGGLEIGYWLHRDFVGRGIARLVTRGLVAEAFRAGVERVEIWHDELNERSGAIPRELGFREVDRVPAAPEHRSAAGSGVLVVWRLTSAEAAGRRAPRGGEPAPSIRPSRRSS